MRVELSRLIAALAITLLLVACGDPGTGPKETKWDRDACERCRMLLSDKHYGAQVRYFPTDKKRSKVLMFDDIGCAALWLEDKPWRDDASTEIWVTDHRTGEWIDARTATYVPGKITPMEYGLGAQAEPAEDGLTYAQAKQHIHEVEKRFNTHGVHLLQRLEEQAREREEQAKHERHTSALPSIKPGVENQ